MMDNMTDTVKQLIIINALFFIGTLVIGSEILQAQFAGNEIKLSDKEKNELEKIKELMEIDKAKYDAHLNVFIAQNEMKPIRYQEIETSFHNNKAFQNKVSSTYNKTN